MMKLTIDVLSGISFIITLVNCEETYRYEKKHLFGLGNRAHSRRQLPGQIFINYNSGGHPATLPPEPLPPYSINPSRSLYQGIHNKSDAKVFKRRFEYEAQDKGHQVLCEGMLNCQITFLALESTEAIPILMRGGVGYTYFTAIIKAKPNRELKGQVRAYCKNDPSQYEGYEDFPILRSDKRFPLSEKEERTSTDND